MAIHLPRPRRDLTLLSTSELTRRLNLPASRMAKAIRDRLLRSLGNVGLVTLIGLTEDEIEELGRTLSTHRKGTSRYGHMATWP